MSHETGKYRPIWKDYAQRMSGDRLFRATIEYNSPQKKKIWKEQDKMLRKTDCIA
jgi:hypothetical protein